MGRHILDHGFPDRRADSAAFLAEAQWGSGLQAEAIVSLERAVRLPCFLFLFLFLDSETVPSPFRECGPDPGASAPGCDSYEPCEQDRLKDHRP